MSSLKNRIWKIPKNPMTILHKATIFQHQALLTSMWQDWDSLKFVFWHCTLIPMLFVMPSTKFDNISASFLPRLCSLRLISSPAISIYFAIVNFCQIWVVQFTVDSSWKFWTTPFDLLTQYLSTLWHTMYHPPHLRVKFLILCNMEIQMQISIVCYVFLYFTTNRNVLSDYQNSSNDVNSLTIICIIFPRGHASCRTTTFAWDRRTVIGTSLWLSVCTPIIWGTNAHEAGLHSRTDKPPRKDARQALPMAETPAGTRKNAGTLVHINAIIQDGTVEINNRQNGFFSRVLYIADTTDNLSLWHCCELPLHWQSGLKLVETPTPRWEVHRACKLLELNTYLIRFHIRIRLFDWLLTFWLSSAHSTFVFHIFMKFCIAFWQSFVRSFEKACYGPKKIVSVCFLFLVFWGTP